MAEQKNQEIKDERDSSNEAPVATLEELTKKDLEDMKHIFTQDDNEKLDIPSMINKVHTEKI